MVLVEDIEHIVNKFEECIQSPQKPSYKSTLLLPIANYSSPLSLKKLARIQVPAQLRNLKLIPGNLLDEKELNWVFQTDAWRQSDKSTYLLITKMPFGVVSQNIKRVGVWRRFEKALEREPSKVAAYGDKAFFVIKGTSANPYLVTIDFKNRLVASSCPEYTSKDPNVRRRFEICKHVASALIYYRKEIFARLKLPKNVVEEWEKSYQDSKLSLDILANYYYYFIKKFVPQLGLRVAYYADLKAVEKAVACV